MFLLFRYNLRNQQNTKSSWWTVYHQRHGWTAIYSATKKSIRFNKLCQSEIFFGRTWRAEQRTFHSNITTRVRSSLWVRYIAEWNRARLYLQCVRTTPTVRREFLSFPTRCPVGMVGTCGVTPELLCQTCSTTFEMRQWKDAEFAALLKVPVTDANPE